jgi:hypothetical protein
MVKATKNKKTDVTLSGWLKNLGLEGLLDEVLWLIGNNSQARKDLTARMESADLGVERIYKSLRRCMDSILEGPDYDDCRYYDPYDRTSVNEWADCSSIVEEIRKLIALSESDNLLPILFDFLVKCDLLITENDDEGDLFYQFIPVAESALNALKSSSLPDYQRIVWSIKLYTSVDCAHVEPFSKYLEDKFTTKTWSLAADALMKEINDDNHHGIGQWIDKILENAGRQNEIIAFAERVSEATGTNSFLIEKLIDAEQLDRAESTLRNNFAKTNDKDYFINLLEIIKTKLNDWNWLIDDYIYLYISQSRINIYEKIKNLAVPHNVWPNIRNSILDFFANGVLPFESAHWNKQEPDSLLNLYYENKLPAQKNYFPNSAVLLNIAILENNPEDAYKWYIIREKNKSIYNLDFDTELKTARTIQSKYTEKAISIYMHCINSYINNQRYQNAVNIMDELAILSKQTNNNKQFNAYINEIRTIHSRKRNLKALMTRIKNI